MAYQVTCLSQNAYFGGFYVLEKPPALSWYYARAVASSLFSRYRHVSQYTWVDYSAADGRTAVSHIQRFRVKCGLLGSEAGKGRLLDLGRMFANDAKTVYKMSFL